MTDDEKDDSPDGELSQWLDEAREQDPPSTDYGALFSGVERDIAKAEAHPLFWLRTRSTTVRRFVAIVAALLVLLFGGILSLRANFDEYPPLQMALALLSLATLLGLSVHQALRPLYRPPLAPAARFALPILTLVATFLLALLPPHGVPAPLGGTLIDHVSPCLFYGLLFGIPVYLVLRLLDRSGTAPLLGACAAGLAGNLVLTLHCPRNDPEHLMLGHFSVAFLFVAGLGLVHFLLRRRREG